MTDSFEWNRNDFVVVKPCGGIAVYVDGDDRIVLRQRAIDVVEADEIEADEIILIDPRDADAVAKAIKAAAKAAKEGVQS